MPVFLGAQFRDNAQCPQCESRERHRAYLLYYQDVEGFPQLGSKVLFVAPSRCVLEALFDDNSRANVVTSDLRSRRVDLQADLTDFPADDASFDRVMCHHVLEHIPADKQAIAEIWRILRPSGIAYIAVPQNFNLERTVEWRRPNPRVSNHVRDYGRDFAQRLEGFDVESINLSTLWGDELRSQYNLGSNEILYHCTKREAG